MNIYKCKSDCNKLKDCCHNTKNRVIEKMSQCDKELCALLGKYLKKLMVMDNLCNYICTCCCEDEKMSSHIKSELMMQCNELINLCNMLHKHLQVKDYNYLNCNKVLTMCNTCKRNNNKRTKSK